MRARLLLTFAATAAVVAAACSGSGGGASGSPTPTPSPTGSLPPDSCQIVWISPDNVTNQKWNLFLVDAPIADWVTGTLGYSRNSPLGVFYYAFNPTSKTASFAALTTAGSFNVTLGSATTAGGAVLWTDNTTQTFYSFDLHSGATGGKVGTGGVGTFNGIWSNPTGAPAGGSGNIAIAWMGSSFNLGGLGKYARCYHTTALQAVGREERIREMLSTIPRTW